MALCHSAAEHLTALQMCQTMQTTERGSATRTTAPHTPARRQGAKTRRTPGRTATGRRHASSDTSRSERAAQDRDRKLLLLYAADEPTKFERAAIRWLSRYLEEGKDVSLLKAHLALAALSELRSRDGDPATKLPIELER